MKYEEMRVGERVETQALEDITVKNAPLSLEGVEITETSIDSQLKTQKDNILEQVKPVTEHVEEETKPVKPVEEPATEPAPQSIEPEKEEKEAEERKDPEAHSVRDNEMERKGKLVEEDSKSAGKDETEPSTTNNEAEKTIEKLSEVKQVYFHKTRHPHS